MRRVFLMMIVTGTVASSYAWAQDNSQPEEARPATPTFWGDTGLWFVPTAEVLRPKGVSFSVYRTEFDFKQGLTDVSDWPVTVAVGAGSRTEVFGALRVVTRIDRDTRPLFSPVEETEDAGLTNDRPFVRETWTGNDLGDLFLGAKINLLTERLLQPLALAFRGTVKVPTADEEKGAGTGKADYFADVIASKEISRRVEVTGFTGYAWRGDPDNISLSDGWRWGAGAAFGARANLRFTAEIFGEVTSDDAVTAVPGVLTAVDGSSSPFLSDLDTGVTTALGLTFQAAALSLGAGVTYQSGLDDPSNDEGRGWGMQFRLGFHRGIKTFVPPAVPRAAQGLAPPPPPPAPEPAPEPPPPPPAPAANRLPTLRAVCDPCRVEVGRTSTIRAESQDPDGDSLQYRWTTPAGTIADPRAMSTMWTAETRPGTVALTVTADDGKGGVASDTVNIEVVGRNIAFEDVQFEFNQATLRPEAIAVLDRAVQTLNANPDVQVAIGGHASAEGTPEYNMSLGDRRAHAVRDYLVSHGVAASRLTTQSFGETMPKYDNTREDMRRLNRRAELATQTR